MSTQNKNVTENLVNALELPKDVLLGLPLLSVSGNSELHIDNHLGILSYQPEAIVVKTKRGPIRIEGEHLVIDWYTRDDMHILGQVKNICFWT